MKRSVLSILILIPGVLVLGFSGCAKEQEDLTDWTITPKVEKKVVETEEAVKPEEEAEQSIKESQPVTYVVKKGDSIAAIAKRHGVSPLLLAEANDLGLEGSKSIIYPGQKIIIPVVNNTIYSYEKLR
jgi:membrane-bound lytic murein transglycosylase D